MGFKDKQQAKEYRRKYYREYYHKNKPHSNSIKNLVCAMQFYKIANTNNDFFKWMICIKDVNDEYKLSHGRTDY